MLVEPLALDLPLAGFNGGLFANPDLSIVEERRLPRDVAEKSVDILAKSGLDIWVYVGNDWLIRSPARRSRGLDCQIPAGGGWVVPQRVGQGPQDRRRQR